MLGSQLYITNSNKIVSNAFIFEGIYTGNEYNFLPEFVAFLCK